MRRGVFGTTYIDMDLLFYVKAAVKEYKVAEKSGYDSFLKEVRKIARIEDIPSIVRVRDLFPENEKAYIVMDFVEGITLKQKLQKDGPMAFSECLALLRPMIEDLDKIHKQGVIHRDISPDNIMLRKDGKVRLLDLGAAKDMTVAHGVPYTQPVVVKTGFSPLERYRDNANTGPWTDVYALCATIYYCITGKMLPAALGWMIGEEEIHFPDSLKEPLPEEVKEALRSGLEVRAEKRTRIVKELLRQLDAGKYGEESVEGM